MRAPLSLAVLLFASVAAADPVLHPGTPALDPPTLVAIGVYLPITGDDNFNATVSVRYRVTGTQAWHDALPLQHAHVEVVQGLTVTPQFAGSIFDLQPGTSYDVELHAVDPDGAVDQTLDLTAQTRALPPAMPAHPRVVNVSDAAGLTAALNAAQPGDVITLADGTYSGAFAINASGTATDPIVITGTAMDGTILDGQQCTGCNVLEVYGSYVHVQSLTLAHANRALRFQTQGAQANVVRYVHIKDVTLAIGSQLDQKDFYIADNVLEGRLTWPCVYTSDDPACNGSPVQHGLHANDDGIHVQGTGHVIAYNRISGFGDAMKTEETGAVSVDFYGNDVLWTYDNGIELDGSARNTRALRNRFTNTFATLSFQPIYGGPAYAIRNVLVNVADEQFKLHANGTMPTVGAVIYHNTIERALRDVQCSTANDPLYFTVANNLFVGPATIADGHSVRWDVPSVATATIDYNGFQPDGQMEYGYNGVTYPNLAGAVAGGMFDVHSTIVGANVFADGSTGPADWTQLMMPKVPDLGAGGAIDKGEVLPNVDDGFTGAAPDLGAIEAGCPEPTYGPRPAGVDESNTSFGCVPVDMPGDTPPGVDHPPAGKSGCGCNGGEPSGAGWIVVIGALLLRRRHQLA